MRKAFKYRLLPNADHERELSAMLETHRRLYNSFLDYKKYSYELGGVSVSFKDLSRKLTDDIKDNIYYQRIKRSSSQCTLRRLDKAFAAFFRRVKAGEKPGYPRFKGRDWFDSFGFESPCQGIRLETDKDQEGYAALHLDFVGAVTVKYHRPIEGTPRSYAVKREAEKWYLVVSCELPDTPIVKQGKPSVGIDMGLSSFLTTSDGHHEPNPRYLKTVLPELRVAGRAVARKKKGSKNRRKAVKRLAKIHAKVKNSRKEHHHQTANQLVRDHDFIATEDLNIKQMVEDGRFSRSISDAGWGQFLNTLEFKAQTNGVAFVKVPARGTSQRCSRCGVIVPKDIRVRVHDCPHCGLKIDRDENGALNILQDGIAARSERKAVKK